MFINKSQLDFIVTVHSAFLLLEVFSVKLHIYRVYKITTISVMYLTSLSAHGIHAIPQELNHHWQESVRNTEINDSFIVNH